MTDSTNDALVNVEGVEKVFHRGSEDIHVLKDLHLLLRSCCISFKRFKFHGLHSVLHSAINRDAFRLKAQLGRRRPLGIMTRVRPGQNSNA